jgi:hypothetical protein
MSVHIEYKANEPREWITWINFLTLRTSNQNPHEPGLIHAFEASLFVKSRWREYRTRLVPDRTNGRGGHFLRLLTATLRFFMVGSYRIIAQLRSRSSQHRRVI